MKHTLNLSELKNQDFEVRVIFASSTKDSKTLKLEANYIDMYKPRFVVRHHKEIVFVTDDLELAINEYNKI